MKKFFNKLKESVLNLMFPENIKCFFCLYELNEFEQDNTCENCLQTLPFIKTPCLKCGADIDMSNLPICAVCKRRNYAFSQARSVFVYKDNPLNIVHNLKYNNHKYLSRHMAKYMSYVYGSWGIFPDFVTSVPMFKEKERKRGYNQSTLLAKDFCSITGLEFLECCTKTKNTETQTALSTNARFKNVENVFEILPKEKEKLKGKTILIIDDVITTGATMSEMSRVLLQAGASNCYALSFAHASVPKDK